MATKEGVLQRLEALEKANELVNEKYKRALRANEALDAKCTELSKDIVKLRSGAPAPMTVRSIPAVEPMYRQIPGQAGWFDQAGNPVNVRVNEDGIPVRVLEPPQDWSKTDAELAREIGERCSAGSGGSLGTSVYKTINGKRYRQDGSLYRNVDTGDVVNPYAVPEPAPVSGPQRTARHQHDIDLLDRSFPLHDNDQTKH